MQVCDQGDYGAGCGSEPDSNDVLAAFTGSPFAQYYADLTYRSEFYYNLLTKHTGPNHYINGWEKLQLIDEQIILDYQRGLHNATQSQWGNAYFASPIGVLAAANAVVGLGKEGMESLGGAVISKLGGKNPNNIGSNGVKAVGREFGFETDQYWV
jgi:hypothetical protein